MAAGTSLLLLTVEKRDGGTDYWLVTIHATPTRASQVQIPEQRTAQVALQANQCPPGLPLDPRTTRLATPEQYAGAGFERNAAALGTAGITSIAESNCTRRDGPTGLWRIGSFAARVNLNPVTHEGMVPAFRAVQDLFRAKTRDFEIFPVSEVRFGDQQEGWTAAFTLSSSGQRNNLLGYTARHGNLIYGVMGQGEVRSVPTPPETMIRQYMQMMKGNLDGVLR